MAIEPLVIAYAGSLAFYEPAKQQNKSLLRRFFGTYQVNNLDISTRSAYYLFTGLQLLLKQYPEYTNRISIQFWGAIDKRTAIQAERMGLGNCVHIEGYKSKLDTVTALTRASVLFLPLESEKGGQRPLFIPGKLYEYLSLRKPVLALAGSSDCTDILTKSGLGCIINPFDTKAIAESIKELADSSPDQLLARFSPKEDYIQQYSFDMITRRLVAIFDDQVSNQPL